MANEISEAVAEAANVAAHSGGVVGLASEQPPTNQEILAAGQKAYAQFQPAVDATTRALVNIIKSGTLKDAVDALDSVNWQSSGITADVTDAFYGAAEVKGALTTVGEFPQLQSFSVGVFSKSLPGSGVGMVGFDRDLRGPNPKTTNGIALTLDLYKGLVKVDFGKNLQFGLWCAGAGSLHDEVTGFYTTVSLDSVRINLKILLSTALNRYGFVVSSGAKVEIPVKVAIFAGATSSPQF